MVRLRRVAAAVNFPLSRLHCLSRPRVSSVAVFSWFCGVVFVSQSLCLMVYDLVGSFVVKQSVGFL